LRAGLRSRAHCLVYVAPATQRQNTTVIVLWRVGGRHGMKKTMAAVTLSLALMSSAAMAQERTGDAALGALSGALVLGPVGAVAGAIVGYSAGPSIASAWGLRRSSYPRRPAEPGPNASYRSSTRPSEAYACQQQQRRHLFQQTDPLYHPSSRWSEAGCVPSCRSVAGS
jgi:hypothetical protein